MLAPEEPRAKKIKELAQKVFFRVLLVSLISDISSDESTRASNLTLSAQLLPTETHGIAALEKHLPPCGA